MPHHNSQSSMLQTKDELFHRTGGFVADVSGVTLRSKALSTSAERTDSVRPLLIPPSVPSLFRLSPARKATSLTALKDMYGITSAKSLGSVIAKANFSPTRSDELLVEIGDIIHPLHLFDDGWCFCVNEYDERGVVPFCWLDSMYDGNLGSTVLIDATEQTENEDTLRSLPRSIPVRASVATRERKFKKGILALLELLNLKRPKAESPSSEISSRQSASATSPFKLRSALRGDNETSQIRQADTLLTPFPPSRRVRFGSFQVKEFESPVEDDSENNLSPTFTNLPDSEDIAAVVDVPYARDSHTKTAVRDQANTYDSSFDALPPPTYEESEGTIKPPNLGIDLWDKSGFKTASEGPPSNTIPAFTDFNDSAQFAVSSKSILDASSHNIVLPDADTLFNSPSSAQSNHVAVEIAKIRYQTLLSTLLAEVSVVDPSCRNHLRNTLMEYNHVLQALDPVTSLVRSREYRANLLQIASALNISDDPKIRHALQADEIEITDTLHFVSHSESYRHMVLALEGDEAQQFLDVVQDVLDKGYPLDDAERVKARRLLVKLSETCDKLPSSLFIKGVERPDAQATFGGGFGDVYRASYKGKLVALKRMRIFQRDPGLPNIRRRFCREALLWQHLNNEFIVPFLGIDAESFPSFLCMVSPWMRHGTILKHLADNGRAAINKRLHEVARGLAYLHSQRIVHGDLRGSNILINEKWQACLTDFGLTVFDDATAATFTSRHEGSVRWMAPELHVPPSFGLDRFRLTPETDIYSFGCVCLELYTGRPPFPEITPDPAVMLKVIRGERPERPSGESAMSNQLWQIVQMCWSHHFADRLKTEEVVEALRKLSSQPTLQPLEISVGSILPNDHECLNSNDLSSSSTTIEEAPWATTNKATELSALSARLPFSIAKQASISMESLNIERFPSFPSLRFFEPFPPYPPYPCGDNLSRNDDDDDLEGICTAEEFLSNSSGMPEHRPQYSSLLPPILPEFPPAVQEERSIGSDTRSEDEVLDELKDYWDIIRDLDAALDTGFSLDMEGSTEVLTSEPSRTSRKSDLGIATKIHGEARRGSCRAISCGLGRIQTCESVPVGVVFDRAVHYSQPSNLKYCIDM